VSLAVKAGVHPKEIQARAGHASITITMDVYADFV
jgi:integrase